MTDSKKDSSLAASLTYEDVGAVSPALEHYTRGPLLDSLWKRPRLRRVIAAPLPWPLPVVKERVLRRVPNSNGE